MELEDFRKLVIENAKKYIFEDIDLDEEKILAHPKAPKAPKLSKPSFTKKGVNKIPKEPKAPKTPKAAEIKVPEKASINESISFEKIKFLTEEMKKINKKIDLRNPLINPDFFEILSEREEKTERWKNLYNYEIPDDSQR